MANCLANGGTVQTALTCDASCKPPPKPTVPAGTTPVQLNVQFSSAAMVDGLNQAQLDTLLQSTINQMILDGTLPAPPNGDTSFYTGSVTNNGDGTATVQIWPAAGMWPSGSAVPPTTTPPGTTVTPPFCRGGLCTATTETSPAPSEPAANSVPILAVSLLRLALV